MKIEIFQQFLIFLNILKTAKESINKNKSSFKLSFSVLFNLKHSQILSRSPLPHFFGKGNTFIPKTQRKRSAVVDVLEKGHENLKTDT